MANHEYRKEHSKKDTIKTDSHKLSPTLIEPDSYLLSKIVHKAELASHWGLGSQPSCPVLQTTFSAPFTSVHQNISKINKHH
jgi:hypothetical protein